ncbi:MAG: Asp-tRNA(Asn)/Glu-tRNA(Gln) amidotransferase subunit GatC [Chloroflexi bacterium]|nr:Asp-tRNA(Asn)/Glu-tRNA(Gln) amidotransferase subunit GatC [Chloroflexota bacterium]
MSLTHKDVEHIAELAKLKLTDEEIERYGKQLSAILDYFEELKQLDTDEIPATASVLSLSNVMREDEPHQTLTRDEILANAPDQENGQFRVKAILD